MTDEIELLKTLERIIAERGLVEFREALSIILDRLEENSFEIAPRTTGHDTPLTPVSSLTDNRAGRRWVSPLSVQVWADDSYKGFCSQGSPSGCESALPVD